MGLLAVLHILADNLVYVRYGVGVLAQLLCGGCLHLHLQQLVIAAKGLVLLGLCLGTLALLFLARISDSTDTLAVGLILVYQLAHVYCVLVHTSKTFRG